MKIHRFLAGVFASVALALAFVLWMDPGSGRPLLAASAGCGGYSGPLCTKSESCIEFFGLFRTCSSVYTYYPASAPSTGSTSPAGAEDEKKESPTVGG